MAFKVAVSKNLGRGQFLQESPAGRPQLEPTQYLNLAKNDFADQTAVNTFVTARGGTAAEWVVLDLTAAGVT
jgi:hypothetical protein